MANPFDWQVLFLPRRWVISRQSGACRLRPTVSSRLVLLRVSGTGRERRVSSLKSLPNRRLDIASSGCSEYRLKAARNMHSDPSCPGRSAEARWAGPRPARDLIPQALQALRSLGTCSTRSTRYVQFIYYIFVDLFISRGLKALNWSEQMVP